MTEYSLSAPRSRIANLLRRSAVAFLRRKLSGPDPLPLRLVFWDGEAVDFAPSPLVTITIGSPRVAGLLMSGNMAALGDAFADGTIDAEGKAQDIVEVGLGLAERIGRIGWAARLAPLIRALALRTRARETAAIAHHYDVSNDFYRLWLDRHLNYSCAYFRTGTEDIDAAQEQKMDHICRKLQLQPGDRLLDIGCGWGGLMCWAARHFGVTALGVTLSRQQYEFVRRRLGEEGLGDRVAVELKDYRDIPGENRFDKIVSVGMFEHVGVVNLPVYFASIERLLTERGLALNHGICTTDPDGAPRGPAGGEFIDRHVFPGGELIHVSQVLLKIAHAGLEAIDMEDLRPHYARTLRLWVHRLESKKPEAEKIVGPARYRIWRIYMAGMAYAFDRGWLTVAQVLAHKRAAAALASRPWTREYQYAD
jgi:cyclopropane-fatty-acyl-phospholipid synthase